MLRRPTTSNNSFIVAAYVRMHPTSDCKRSFVLSLCSVSATCNTYRYVGQEGRRPRALIALEGSPKLPLDSVCRLHRLACNQMKLASIKDDTRIDEEANDLI